LKFLLTIIFIGLTTISHSQKNYDFAKIKEYHFYRLDYNDSFQIAYYKSGALKYEQKEEREIWYYYIDSSKNDNLYSSILTLPRFPYQNCKDSTRDVFKYHDGILSEIDTYSKVCYKERDGCFVYDNTNAGQWCLTARQFYKMNEQNDCIKQIFISEHDNRLDTSISRSEYTYDTQGRRTQYLLFENGKLDRKVNYKYFDDIVREEFYYPEDSSARVITDYKYQNGQLVEMFIDRKYNGTSDTERYLYIQPNRLSSIEYISDRTNLFKVRKYYYE
jgi:hypothetical protein